MPDVFVLTFNKFHENNRQTVTLMLLLLAWLSVCIIFISSLYHDVKLYILKYLKGRSLRLRNYDVTLPPVFKQFAVWFTGLRCDDVTGH